MKAIGIISLIIIVFCLLEFGGEKLHDYIQTTEWHKQEINSYWHKVKFKKEEHGVFSPNYYLISDDGKEVDVNRVDYTQTNINDNYYSPFWR